MTPLPTRRRRLPAAVLALSAAALCGLPCAGALAQASPVPEGRLLASNCFQCHGTNGRGPGFDRLAGKSASKLLSELREFRSGQEGNGIMARHALGYTDAQLAALARYLSTQR